MEFRITNLYPGEVNTPILNNRKIASLSRAYRESILQPDDVATVILKYANSLNEFTYLSWLSNLLQTIFCVTS